jgi:ketosteroid isomerase-like protein
MTKLIIGTFLLLISGCSLIPTSPPSRAEVQEFVRQYFAASNSGDASKLMELVSRESTVSSIGYGKIDRGWEEIRKTTDTNIAEATRVRVTVGTVEVAALGTDYALAIAPLYLTSLQVLNPIDVPGAVTMLVKRTPEGIRLVHEHFSVGTP